MGKPTICIGENKDADQLCSNCTADQRLCFRYSDSTFPLLLISKVYISSSTYIQSFKLLALFCDYTAWFVLDLVGNKIVGFVIRRLNAQNYPPIMIKLSINSH